MTSGAGATALVRDGSIKGDFALDAAAGGGIETDKFEADANAGKTIAHLAAGLHGDSGKGEAKADVQDGALRKMAGSIHEHAAHADVRGADKGKVGLAFIVEDDAGNGVNAGDGTRRRGE